ncbi:hypothetical protein GBAR_LOCUS22510 [Geodia barretti]|uniref:Uncharacterized protein n=1 Tax=Geodia barretti TaxID=519541 RepID=A0AA35X7C9_GEOBA|nr:hypothetical protein GBAR_LOCUS22510 [Geodia barretti]
MLVRFSYVSAERASIPARTSAVAATTRCSRGLPVWSDSTDAVTAASCVSMPPSRRSSPSRADLRRRQRPSMVRWHAEDGVR